MLKIISKPETCLQRLCVEFDSIWELRKLRKFKNFRIKIISICHLSKSKQTLNAGPKKFNISVSIFRIKKALDNFILSNGFCEKSLHWHHNHFEDSHEKNLTRLIMFMSFACANFNQFVTYFPNNREIWFTKNGHEKMRTKSRF